ncbi:MAG TPA: TonB family protein [Candidatus Acidoferrales bacterium]|nr:TonB family protein [Candidatus Acidoferrales bacterium]
MPDAARIAQAQALEVPLILQGAKTVEGTDRRELFKENATTTLVFDNGAVLNLRCKLVVGQAVFIHNEQNGREILSRVVEAPPENETGFTELEFTSADPDFWNSAALRPPASAQNPPSAAENPGTSGQPSAPAEDTLAMMSATASKIHLPNMVAPGKESGGPLREELMPAHEMVPDSSSMSSVPVPSFEPAVTTESNPTEPTGEQIDAALRQMSGAAGAATPLDGGEAPSAGGDSEKDQQHLAAMMERDARLAKFVAFKEKQAEKLQREAAPKEAPEAATEFQGTSEPTAVWTKAALLDKLTTGKNATYATIGAAALIVVALFFVWRAMRDVFIHPSDAPAASATTQPKSTATLAPAADASAPIVPTASGPTIPPTAARSVKAPQPIVMPAPKATRATRAPAEAQLESNRDEATAGRSAAASAGRIPEAAGAAEIIPARVVSQPQPTLPPWAHDLELDGVVTMDVTINQTGNVTKTKVLSGPRALQHEAARALSLWQFVPAQSGGKPISSHITLSVEFLPPPPPKRFP